MSNDKPIMTLLVACDSRTIQTIAVTCRCGNRWTERVPREVHDSDLICIFQCVKCNTQYSLKNHQLSRLQEDANGRRQNFPINTQQYDA